MLAPFDFLGSWRVERLIDDRRAGVQGRFDGTAAFADEGAALRYREEGTLRLGEGRAFAATRESLWRWDRDGVEVLFADGRPFHRFVPEARGAGTDHLCGRDLYRVVYDLSAWPRWSTRWEVQGPSKSYVLRTAYARA
jgi:hypothetical protein